MPKKSNPHLVYLNLIVEDDLPQVGFIGVHTLRSGMKRLERQARKVGALGVANAYRRAAARLNAMFIDGHVLLTMPEWDEVSIATGIAETPALWHAHYRELAAEDEVEAA